MAETSRRADDDFLVPITGVIAGSYGVMQLSYEYNIGYSKTSREISNLKSEVRGYHDTEVSAQNSHSSAAAGTVKFDRAEINKIDKRLHNLTEHEPGHVTHAESIGMDFAGAVVGGILVHVIYSGIKSVIKKHRLNKEPIIKNSNEASVEPTDDFVDVSIQDSADL
jgi:hypothetical protein